MIEHHRRFIWPACALAVLLGVAPALAQRAARSAPTAPVVTLYEVKLERINDRVAAVGTGRARRQVMITTRVAGVIDEVLFQGGEKVSHAQPLLRLAAEPEAIAVDTAEAQRAQAADVVARYKQLDQSSITRVARAEADTALKVADAALRRARETLDRMTIKAPFSGTIGLSNLQAGDYVGVGSPIATLDDRSTLLIEFTVPEAIVSEIKTGLPVRANLIARSGEIYNGKVQAVGTRIDPVSRTMTVRAELDNPEDRLVPGSTFSVSVRLPGNEAPVVPALSVQWDRQGAFVWKLDDKNQVARVGVAILTRNSDRILIDAKLAAGDRIIFEGGDDLRVGQLVRPLPTAERRSAL